MKATVTIFMLMFGFLVIALIVCFIVRLYYSYKIKQSKRLIAECDRRIKMSKEKIWIYQQSINYKESEIRRLKGE